MECGIIAGSCRPFRRSAQMLHMFKSNDIDGKLFISFNQSINPGFLK